MKNSNKMTIGNLKALIQDISDDTPVLIPFSQEFDGVFYSPCLVDSGVCAIGTDMDVEEEDIAEMELLGKPIPEIDTFILVPAGFYEEKSHKYELN